MYGMGNRLVVCIPMYVSNNTYIIKPDIGLIYMNSAAKEKIIRYNINIMFFNA